MKELQILLQSLRRFEANLLIDNWYQENADDAGNTALFAEIKNALDNVRTSLWCRIQASSLVSQGAPIDLVEHHRLSRTVDLLRSAPPKHSRPDHVTAPTQHRIPDSPERQENAEGPMKYILVVDDDPVVNLLITRELQKAGYGVLMAYDAVQAATNMRRSRLDVVIVDVMLPGGNAFDVIKRMKTSNRLVPIPIVAISSAMTPEMAAKLTQEGADCCMKKPLDIEFLLKIIKNMTAEAPHHVAHHHSLPETHVGATGDLAVATAAS